MQSGVHHTGCPSVVGHFQRHLYNWQGGWHWNLLCGVFHQKEGLPSVGYCGVWPRVTTANIWPHYWQANLARPRDKLDFKEKTVQIDKILLHKRNIANLQLKPSISRALRHNSCLAQESVSTRSATKRVVKILDTKYEKVDLPAIVRENCSHLNTSDRDELLSMLLK